MRARTLNEDVNKGNRDKRGYCSSLLIWCYFLFASLHLYDYVYESADKILLFDSIHCYS